MRWIHYFAFIEWQRKYVQICEMIVQKSVGFVRYYWIQELTSINSLINNVK